MVAKIKRWAALEGYDSFVTFAGANGSRGSVYRAAGFECVNDDDPEVGGGDGWQSRGGRAALDEFDGRKFVIDLEAIRCK